MIAQNENISLAFLKDAMRHFICLSYRARSKGAETEDAKLYYASCFVIEAEGHWFLVTAAHVIEQIKTAISHGFVLSDVHLHDRLAGNTFRFAVPFYLKTEDWLIDSDRPGADYAATWLAPLIVENLRTGGIRPLDETTWGWTDRLEDYSQWLLVGIPDETHAVVGWSTSAQADVDELGQPRGERLRVHPVTRCLQNSLRMQEIKQLWTTSPA